MMSRMPPVTPSGLLIIFLVCQKTANSSPTGSPRSRQNHVLPMTPTSMTIAHHEIATGANLKVKSNLTGTKMRRRRYDYEDVYEWSDDDASLNYELEVVEEPSLLLKIARNWRTAGLRLVFLGAFVIMVALICGGICRVACKYWCKSLCENFECCGFPGVKKYCQYCYSDPMYEKVKELGDVFGIKISYAMYEKIKDHYIDDSEMGWGAS